MARYSSRTPLCWKVKLHRVRTVLLFSFLCREIRNLILEIVEKAEAGDKQAQLDCYGIG